ncbi:SAM-dependent DNA methyltransferase [Oxynema aestuarii AP17]|uniref:site-specific DNA-methyltransferase (adenine-specific) n=2 Tax=Oxynema TaxID=1492710 RepID=A0A6H1TZV0_9CYAN|nr:SAM-dependent DNA methyltransferase [Oxynema aestuarii]QIZ71677.1 SAM-dependent DNA methyltransferase [Oxynema aestuarii AP17]
MIMRCVVILFAEARNLLPRENPIYHESYGIQGLRELLTRQAGGRAGERLRNSFSAWPRLLSLFRLVYSGSAHPELIVPRYGGKLFVPGDSLSSDPIARALAIFENPANSPSDAMVYRMLELLTRSKVKVRQGRRSTWVEAPVDFSGLSSEYIGILYEGLLDFELRQVEADNPIVFLNLGDRPALPLQRLEEMDDKALKALVEKLKQKAKPSTSEDEEESDDDAEAEAEESEAEVDEEEEDSDTDADAEAEDGDRTLELRQRATNWAIRAVKVGSLVTKPKSKKREALAEYETAVETMAKRLILEVLLPGEWFLVRWGGTRKGSGTFYTRPQLAVPTVRRTLLPLAYNPPVDEALNPDGKASAAQWHPKTPQEILDVKVCDPACGSGSFLIAALGFLTDALYESLFYHGWLREDPITQQVRVEIAADAIPQWFAECVKDLPLTLEHIGRERDAPTSGEETSFSRHRLKRYVVERCIYGVDIDALAVELARLSLWVETMDKSLPFSFLDHKVKCGNSLVGCWFDRFQDYPVMAWERDAGDANHDKFVHHYREYVAKSGKKKGQAQQKGDKWTQGIKDTRNSRVKEELTALLKTLDPSKPIIADFETTFPLPKLPEAIHDEAVGIFLEWHDLPIDYDSEEKKENEYEQKFRQDKAIQQLKQAFDSWCAVWFWPGDELEIAPTPQHFFDPTPEMAQRVAELAQQYQFFHWELEFPDVFAGVNDGFTAIVGNPPWETLQPNSMEFFSNIDPLYRTYGKQEALAKQVEYFQSDPQIEKSWLLYCDNLKALSNWTKNVGFPFGDPEEDGGKFSLSRSSKETELLHDLWRQRRQQHIGYADKRHPFRYQGEGKPYTQKLFAELGHILLKDGGRLSLIVPSGLYSDKGAGDLRNLFLNCCQWTHLYAFQNERFVFKDIDHRNKMVMFTVVKGGSTDAIATRFRLGPGDSPTAQELETDILGDRNYLSVPASEIRKFSPNTGALLEIRSDRDLAILEKMYDNGVLLGDDSPEGWGIQYRQGDFNMTSDSKLFPPRPQWEAKGYRADEYGHWLKGNWQPYDGSPSILQRPEGLILSVDGTSAIHVDEVEDVALPLYQGIMIHQFDFSPKGWISGTGVRAIWEEITWEHKSIRPQYLITAKDAYGKPRMIRGTKPSVRRVARNTDYRTTICGLVPDMPCGDKASIFAPIQHIATLALPAYLNSYAFDSVVRSRVGGTQLDYHIAAEIPTACGSASENNQLLAIKVLQLNGAYTLFAEDWIKLRTKFANTHKIIARSWYQLWAITPHERLRLRCILDAVVAELYGLDIEDFTWILRDCDYPAAQVCDNAFARTLEPKGFWRVDKDKDPELRHTVLSQIAFHELKRLGLEPFLNLNDGEGWMLPDTVRLADYGLGHDPRAEEPQPVAARLGDRFLPWQLEGTIEDSWQECERHADNLRRLLGDTPQTFNQENNTTNDTPDTPRKTEKLPSDPDYVPPTDRFGNPLNVDLFGNIIEPKSKRKKQ